MSLSSSSASRHDSRSSASASGSRPRQPATALTASNPEIIARPPSTPQYRTTLDPCAATVSFLLVAQRNHILVLHSDTLALERRFALHREHVIWMVADNASERGAGRLAVSYDAGKTAIVWDILTGGEVARFSAYEHMRVGAFMRNGNLAFGNDQGNIILFEPSTSEHYSARTIFDPITALAPSADCKTFAIGYMNGSILIATLQPSFTILHTLTTTRAPTPIAALSWHGSSSKQKTDMLATQTIDGDLRVWSVPKQPSTDVPNIIRVLQRVESRPTGPCWFAWSKTGRIVQHAEGETRAWDVRTKKVSWEAIPTHPNIVAMANFGPNATLFTVTENYKIQLYDITPSTQPVLVREAQHPLTTSESGDYTQHDNPFEDTDAARTSTDTEGSSADEGRVLSPMQRIAREMDSLDALESELRDQVGPLSPSISSRSSASSRSTHSRRRTRKYLYDKPGSSRASSSSGFTGTEFSATTPLIRPAHESMSIRSVSSYMSRGFDQAQPQQQPPMPRRENILPQTPAAGKSTLFPYTDTQLDIVAFRTPHYGTGPRNSEMLQREMLSVVFGWNDDARSLVRNELERHVPGSASAVLLSKWLGEGADNASAMLGSEGLTSTDWMLLALNSIGPESQKKVGETFVQRLLEKGDVHPAVGILIGLGEFVDAIEVYVSQSMWLEAVLLSCISMSSDWQRISYLLRKWGETAVRRGQAELAVRLFSCTSIETTEPWFSPRAQDAVFAAQQERFAQMDAAASAPQSTMSPPISPPSRSGSGRLTAMNASLKLITSFDRKDGRTPGVIDEQTPMINNGGITPIAQSAMPPSAMSPGGAYPWPRSSSRNARDSSINRTATPGDITTRRRLPSRSDIERAKMEAAAIATPITAARDKAPSTSRRTSSVSSLQAPQTAVRNEGPPLPSPAHGVFARLREQSESRHGSKDRKPEGLAVQVMETQFTDHLSPSDSLSQQGLRNRTYSPPPTGMSTASTRARAVDDYVNSVDAARDAARENRAQSRRRGESRGNRSTSRVRDRSETRDRHGVRYIKAAKRSPSSPIPMSPEEIAEAATRAARHEPATTDDEQFYKVASPVDSPRTMWVNQSAGRRPSVDVQNVQDVTTGAPSVKSIDTRRGRSSSRKAAAENRSTSSPSPPLPPAQPEVESVAADSERNRLRARSRTTEQSRERRAASRSRRDRSTSQRPSQDRRETDARVPSLTEDEAAKIAALTSAEHRPRARPLTKKELAAKELEDRRLSLARRPSAPLIPLPGEFSGGRPMLTPRSQTDLSPAVSSASPFARSYSVDPEQMSRYNRTTGISTASAPIGLPATPRAMRHPRQIGGGSGDASERDVAPPVPELPENASQLSSVMSSHNGSQANASFLSSAAPSSLTTLSSNVTSNVIGDKSSAQEVDDSIGPLLPATVYGQPKAPPRAASAPPEKSMGNGVHPAYKAAIPASSRRQSIGRPGHVRKISPADVRDIMAGPTSIDATLAQHDQVINVSEMETPEILPELRHLAMPPPPPPPPPPPHFLNSSDVSSVNSSNAGTGSGVINIHIGETNGNNDNEILTLPATTYPQPMERASTASPMHLRSRGSISEQGAGQTFTSRFRGLGERMRSTSRSRAKSPPLNQQSIPDPPSYRPAPYESVGGGGGASAYTHQRGESITRAKSPYEKAMAGAGGAGVVGYESMANMTSAALPVSLEETSMPPLPTARSASTTGVRTQVRANMPPDTLQQGVYGGGAGYL